jgi:23S rRNA (guanosine2251-2'-O)-methyltransferase
MAGNSERRGARRSTGSKKGQTVGSGGQRRKQLRGRGPTPKAADRPGHVAARRAATRQEPGRGPAPGRRGPREAAEVVAGRNAVVEALRAGVPARTLWIAERVDADERIREAVKRATTQDLPLLEVPRAELDRLTGRAVHQGIALQVRGYEYVHPDVLLERAADAGEPALVVALDGVTDPRNLGAVVRSAAAFGAHGVLVPERRAAGMTAAAWKVSAGAAARLPVARATNLARQLRAYRTAGLFVAGLAAHGPVDVAAVPVADRPLVLVLGSESSGLSRIVSEACDVVVSIPMAGDVESLNAGVAAGIALYAVRRSRDAAQTRPDSLG